MQFVARHKKEMKKKKIKRAVIILIIGILMHFMAVSIFTYQGNINSIISSIGMLSVVLWIPVVIVGLVLLIQALFSKT